MTTMDLYSHMLPDDFENRAKAMDQAARAGRNRFQPPRAVAAFSVATQALRSAVS